MSALKPSPSSYLAALIEEHSFALEGLAELLRLTGWAPESVVLEMAAQSILTISRTVRRSATQIPSETPKPERP